MASYGIIIKYKNNPQSETIWHKDKTERDNVLRSWTPRKILQSNVVSVKPIQK